MQTVEASYEKSQNIPQIKQHMPIALNTVICLFINLSIYYVLNLFIYLFRYLLGWA